VREQQKLAGGHSGLNVSKMDRNLDGVSGPCETSVLYALQADIPGPTCWVGQGVVRICMTDATYESETASDSFNYFNLIQSHPKMKNFQSTVDGEQNLLCFLFVAHEKRLKQVEGRNGILWEIPNGKKTRERI
jgi:hypothetical protein